MKNWVIDLYQLLPLLKEFSYFLDISMKKHVKPKQNNSVSISNKTCQTLNGKVSMKFQ